MAKNNQPSLFEDFESEDTNKFTEVAISKNAVKELSKEQVKFNKLNVNIDKLEKELSEKEVFLDKILNIYIKDIDPIIEKEARFKIKVAFELENLSFMPKLSKKTKEKITDIIIVLMEKAFDVVMPDEKEKALYDRHNPISFNDEIKVQTDHFRSKMEFMFSEAFGMDIDLSDVDINDPEQMARLQKEIQDRLAQKMEEEALNPKNVKKKTAKQLAKEELEKAKEAAKKRDLKSIYLTLSKALHPDKESDPILKMDKEELMKKVTAAYQNKDFPTLLKLELEWVQKNGDRLNELTDDQLKVYNELLIEKENELKRKKNDIIWNPRYQKVLDLVNLKEKNAIIRLNQQKIVKQELLRIFEENISNLKFIADRRKEFSQYIDDMHKDFVEPEFDSFFFD
jgi:hypothetical protein